MIRLEAPEGYEPVRPLVQGGSESVVLARHVKSGKSVVLKYLHFAAGDLRERFLREGRIVSQLEHPNIVAGRGIEFVDDTPVIVFEYVDGPDLATMSELEGRMLPGRALEIVKQMLLGLQHAHDAGVVHRNLKPANVMVASDGTVKVADFGAASLREAFEQVTRTGTVIGTPGFMAPEQAAGAHVDLRADLYAVGVILFGLLSRELPITGSSTVDVLKRIATATPRRLDEVVPGTEKWLSDVIARCLEKKPENRYPSASALAHVLDLGGAAPRRVVTARLIPALVAPGAGMTVDAGASSGEMLSAKVQLPADWRESGEQARAQPGARAMAPWMILGAGCLAALAILILPAGPGRKVGGGPGAHEPARLGLKNALGGDFIVRESDRLVFAFELDDPQLLKAVLRGAGGTIELERADGGQEGTRQAFLAPAQLVLKPFAVELSRSDGVPVQGGVVEHGGLLSVLNARVRVPHGSETSWAAWMQEVARVAEPGLVSEIPGIARAFPPPRNLDPTRTVFRVLAGKAKEKWRLLLAVAPFILDSPTADLAERKAAYESLLPLRLLDRAQMALGADRPPLAAEEALGITFGTQELPLDGKLDRPLAESKEALGALSCPEVNATAETHNILVDVVNKSPLGKVSDHRWDTLDTPLGPFAGRGPRLVRLEVQTRRQEGAAANFAPDELIWIKVSGWTLLVHSGCSDPDDELVTTKGELRRAMHRMDPALVGKQTTFRLTREVLPMPVAPPVPPAKQSLNRKTELIRLRKLFLRTRNE